MSALGADVVDADVIDLFAGSGALGLEALSRGARSVTFIEQARGALRTLKANVELLGATESCTVVAEDVFRFLARSRDFDLALADPPYGTGASQRLLQVWMEEPFADQLWLEHRTGESLPLPSDARTRRYGDTSLTTLTAGR